MMYQISALIDGRLTKHMAALVALGLLLWLPCLSRGDTILPSGGQAGLAQQFNLMVRPVAGNSNLASFFLSNQGPVSVSVTGMYFAEPSLAGIDRIIDGPGVTFVQTPSSPDFRQSASPALGVEALAPMQTNGVNNGEWVEVVFALRPDLSFSDVFDGPNSLMQVGLRVQGLSWANGYPTASSLGTASFNILPQVVPVPLQTPVALGLGLLGSLGIFSIYRKRVQTTC